MDIKWKSWNEDKRKRFIIAVILIFMIAESITWLSIKPRLLKEAKSKDRYTESALFQDEFNKCVDTAVELALDTENPNKLQMSLDSKENLIYFIYNNRSGARYSNIKGYSTTSFSNMEYVDMPGSKPYYTSAFFADTGYRVYYDDSAYYKEVERQNEGLKERLKDERVAIYIGVRSQLNPGDVFYANSQKFVARKENLIAYIDILVWSLFIVAGGIMARLWYKLIRQEEWNAPFNKFPMDLVALFIGIGSVSIFQLVQFRMIREEVGIIFVGMMSSLLIIGVFCQRQKKCLLRTTVLYQCIQYCSNLKRLPLGMLIGSMLYLLVDGILLIGCLTVVKIAGQFALGIGLIIWNVGGLLLVWCLAKSLQEVVKAAINISEGDIAYQIHIDKKGFILKTLGEKLNQMGSGLDKAVKDAMKSEVMKTELITNVSHDLKTPLTSIINYIGLLKKQEISDHTARGYLEILDEKSKRLKVLIEDLVDLSKVTTGNVQVELEILDLVQFMDQAIGEYTDRLMSTPIEVKFKCMEESLFVLADGKHLWRIVENLLSNVIKYGMPHSRMYIELTREKGLGCLTIKNMTKEVLEVTPEDLLQRFVRGDQARSTEGSGLGLAIAKSLVEAQQGCLELNIDGDLFKVKVMLQEGIPSIFTIL